MELEDIFDKFSDKITQLQLYQRTIKKMAEEELNKLTEYYKSFGDKPELLERSAHRMLFYDAETGEARTFGRREFSVEDRIKAVVFHKNKQYQWLLAEAYEAFEDYIEYMYAYAGVLDTNLWSLRHLKNISLSELSNKDFNWFKNQAYGIKIKNSILNQFRKSFPYIKKIELENKLNINLKLAIILIEHLRHIIVHNYGIARDKKNFIKNVLTKAGLYNNGKPRQEHIKFIKNYFGPEEYNNNIALLEVRILPDIPFDITINRFDLLTSNLMSYSFIIAQRLQEHKKTMSV